MRIVEVLIDSKVRRLMRENHITDGQIRYLCGLPLVLRRASELDMCIVDDRDSITPCVQVALEGLNPAQGLAVIKARDLGLYKKNHG